MLDKARLIQAFGLLGGDLARRGLFVEVAVYGACAILLQFDWRRPTEDVDALVRPGYAEDLIHPSVALVAAQMILSPDWLNNAVGMFTPLHEDDTLFVAAGSYPSGDRPGLRVFVASPAYLLAMKLRALQSFDRGDKDLLDARALAIELGIGRADELVTLFRSVFDEDPPEAARQQFPAVLGPQS